MSTASKQMRLWFAFFGVLIWVGILLTGFSKVHWSLYVPAAGMIFAAVTGICPSQVAVFRMFPSKEN